MTEDQEPRRPAPTLIRLCVAFLSLLCVHGMIFRGLIRDPSALLADADRPSVDRYLTRANPPGNDLTRLFLPHHLHVTAQARRWGRVPGWDDRGFCGRPLVGNPQASNFYPPVWLVWLANAPSGLGWLTVGHLVFLGLGLVVLGESVGLSPWAALFAGVVGSANPYVLAQVAEGHLPHVWSVAWFPWVLWFLTKRGGRSLALASLCLALSFWAGHLQEWFYFNLVLATAALISVVRSRGRDPRVIRLALCWLLTVGLIAVELVPDLLIRAETIKAEATSLGRSSRYGPALLNIPQLVDPFALGTASDFKGQGNFWEGLLSIGLVPFLCLLMLLFDAEKRREHRPWILSLAGCLVFAAGPGLGLYAIAYQLVPWLDSFRVPARMLFVAVIPAALLAGAGFDVVRSRPVKPSALLIVWLLMALATVVVWHSGGKPRVEPWFGLIILSILIFLMRWSVLGSRLTQRRFLALLVGLLGVAELVGHSQEIIVVSPAERWLAHAPSVAAVVGASGLPVRVRADDRFYDDLKAVLDGVEKTNVGDSFQLDRPARLYRRLYRVFDPHADDVLPASLRPDEDTLDRLAERMLDLLSVEFLIGHDPQVPLVERHPLVASHSGDASGLWTRRNPTALPRAYVVGRVVAPAAVKNPVEDLLRLDPREGVLLSRDPLAPGTTRQAFRPAMIVASGPDYLTIEVDLDAPGILVVTSAWSKGWRATVNGKPTEVLPANVALRAVPLRTSGRQRVELCYMPPGLWLGSAISGTAVLVWIALVCELIRLCYDGCR